MLLPATLTIALSNVANGVTLEDAEAFFCESGLVRCHVVVACEPADSGEGLLRCRFVLSDGESMSEPSAVALQQTTAADEVLAQRMYVHVPPHPPARLTEPIELKTFHSLGIPRSYRVGTHDPVPRHAIIIAGPIIPVDSIIEAGRDA
jgi:hypothetical protein